MTLDEKVLREHIEDGPFQSGVDLGKWKLISISWPLVYIEVKATSLEEWPSFYCFQFECSNYPVAGVTAKPWDVGKKNQGLDRMDRWKSRSPGLCGHLLGKPENPAAWSRSLSDF